jgi:hypothetical protein
MMHGQKRLMSLKHTVGNKKVAVFWVVALCSLVEVYQHFETLVEDSQLHTHRRENLKSYSAGNKLLQTFTEA